MSFFFGSKLKLMAIEVESVISKTWRPNHGKQELYLSLPDSIFEQFYGGAAGGGKLGDINWIINTFNDGPKTLENINVGDIVFDSNGAPTPVIGSFDIVENAPCYKFILDDGSEYISADTHPWITLTYQEREKNKRRTPEFREKRKLTRISTAFDRREINFDNNYTENRGRHKRADLAELNSNREYNYLPQIEQSKRTTLEIFNTLKYNGKTNHSINVSPAWMLPEQYLMIHPYVLGCWLGDGSSSGGGFTNVDDEIIYRLHILGYKIDLKVDQKQHYIKNLVGRLQTYNLINNKHIPFIYFKSSIEQRLELLRGLIDTDGYVAEDGSIEISSSYPQLARDIYLLVNSLGIKASKTINDASYKDTNGNIIKCKDRTRIKFITNLKVAHLSRKKNRIIDRNIDERNKVRYIVDCIPVPSIPTKCIQVLSDTHCYQIGDNLVSTHNSEALLMRPIIRGWTDIPGFKALILRRTFRELEESLIQRSKIGKLNRDGTQMPTFYDLGATYNEQKKRWTWPVGATITFGHAEEEADVKKYDTAEYQYIAFDELTSFTEFQYKFLAFSRCRSTIPGVPALVCSASNPGNIGHRWVRERFVEACPQGGKIIAEKIQDKFIKRIFIQAFLSDNPKLAENDPEYQVRLEMLPEADKKAKLYGDWWTFTGQAFNEFRTEPFVDEPNNACHIAPPHIPDLRLPRVMAIDWGYAHMTFVLWGVKLPNKRVTIYREFTPNPINDKDKKEFGELDSKTVESWTTHIANICLTEGINPYIVLDPSAWQNRGVVTIADQFIKTWKEVTLSSPRIEKADNDRSSGKMLVHDYLRWKPRPKYNLTPPEQFDKNLADWILRNKGLISYNSYMAQFVPQSEIIEENIPKLQITADCKLLLKTIPLCVYEEENSEDVKKFVGDDPYDDLRYLLKKLDTLNVGDLPTLLAPEFKNANEITNFYRRMEKLESENKRKTSYIMMGRSRRRRR